MTKIIRPGVEDKKKNLIKVGDTVRHTMYGRDAKVLEVYTRVENGARWNEILVEGPNGEWDPKLTRKL